MIEPFQNLADKIGLLRRRQRMRKILRAIHSTPEGREFFEQFLRDAGVTKPRLARDPYEIAFNEGKRHLAQSYLALLSSDDAGELIARLESESNKQNTTI